MAHLKIINVRSSPWHFIRQKDPPLPTRHQAEWKTAGVEDVEDRKCLTDGQTELTFLGRATPYSSRYTHCVISAPLGQRLSLSILCDKDVRWGKCTLWRIKPCAYVFNESESKSFGLKENCHLLHLHVTWINIPDWELSFLCYLWSRLRKLLVWEKI